MKNQAKVIVGNVCMHVGPHEVRNPITRDFKVKAGWVTAEVRLSKGTENDMRILGQRITDPADIDLIIDVLKTAKKLLKLKMDSQAAIAKLVEASNE